MKKLIFLFAIIAIATSCEPPIRGNGNIIKTERKVADFDEVDISGSFEVHLMQADRYDVTVQADDNLQEHIDVFVKGDRLHIKSDHTLSSEGLKIFVTTKNLKEIETSGASEVYMKNQFNAEDFKIDVSGAAQLDLDLRCADLDIDVSGACELTAKGVVEEMHLQSSGASEVKATDLKISKCWIDLSGAGEVDIWAVEELHVQVSGAGEVNYKGSPERITQDISGAATVTQLN